VATVRGVQTVRRSCCRRGESGTEECQGLDQRRAEGGRFSTDNRLLVRKLAVLGEGVGNGRSIDVGPRTK
jgi:hypothetical protein